MVARVARPLAGAALHRNVYMPKNHTANRPGQPLATPASGAKTPWTAAGLTLPHERDESAATAAPAPDPQMVQAKRDIDAGLVDTDMHVTPGLDAKLRARLVPGPGGKPPPKGA